MHHALIEGISCMKNVLIAFTGWLLFSTTMPATNSTHSAMEWSPIPTPDTRLEPSPTLLNAYSVAEAGLPASIHELPKDLLIGSTATYSDYALYNRDSGIILRAPEGDDIALGACTLVINGEQKGLIFFNDAGTLVWNTQHLTSIQEARR